MPELQRQPIDCEEALRRLAEYLDHELRGVSAIELEKHLETCRSCYSRAQFERALKTRLGELRDEPIDPAFESRICDLTRGFTRS